MRFIYQSPTIHTKFPTINPMSLVAPWTNAYIELQQKEQSSVRFIYQYTVTNLSNCLEENQCIYDNRINHKNWPPRHSLPQECGGGNPFVQFGYVPLKIFCHNHGQFSVSMNAYTINMIHTSQQINKIGLEKIT